MPTKVSKNAREDELVRKGTKVLEVAVILIVGLIAVGLVFPSVLTLALEIALGIAVSMTITLIIFCISTDPMDIHFRIGTILVILLLFCVFYFVLSTYLSVENALSNSAQPYLNTSHYPVFTPYIQNTSIWLSINGSIYQYWASLDNYQAGIDPCVLRMSAVENGNITHTLNNTEANATLASVQITEASGNSPKQPEYANPVMSYLNSLSICSNYEAIK